MAVRIDEVADMDVSDVADGRLKPVTPGDVLRHDFMEPMGLTANALARALGVPANRITGILNGRRSVTADTAYRLALAFGTSPAFWLNLQTQYDLEVMERTKAGELRKQVHRLAA